MPLPKLSLQALEAFEHVARFGSMRRAARELGMSISSVSNHVARLEGELGVVLIDRSSRPFRLTREGREALLHLTVGLQHLRRATSETTIGGLLGARSLRIGIIEDFESNVAPELAVVLAGRMPRATLTIGNVLSHEAPALLRKGELDLAIASEADGDLADLQTHPLVRDPFMIAAPEGASTDAARLLDGRSDLPLLRFNRNHLIGRRIEAHLARNQIDLPDRYAFDSAQSIMAVVANGDGWSILTPLGFARARRFAESVRLHPLPFASFARRIALTARNDFDRSTAEAVAALVRDSVKRMAVDPICAAHPWLEGAFFVEAPER